MIHTIRHVILLTLFSSVFVISAYAQQALHLEDESNTHEHLKNEIGFAVAPVYLLSEKEFAFGLHMHYVRNIASSKFGFGAGYERVFDKHKHNNLGVIASFRPVEDLCFELTPGLNFEGEEPGVKPAIHFETTYEFEMKYFHMGPVFELAYAPGDWHISLGLHIGHDF